MRHLAIMILMSACGSKDASPPGQPPASAFALSLSPPTASPAAAPPAAPAPAAASACRAAAERLGQLSHDMTKVDGVTAECEQNRWPEKLPPCIARAADKDDIQACAKLAFEDGKVEFQPQRVVDVTAGNVTEQDPPMFTQNGDVIAFRANGQRCGMIGMYSGPAYATFLICGGSVLAGPLTTDAEVQEAFQIVANAGVAEINGMAQQEQQAFDIAKSVRDRWPTGGGTTRVYDRASGRPLYDTY